MEISKPGRDVENIYRKTCPICGCEFKFAEWEIKTDYNRTDPNQPPWHEIRPRYIVCPNATCRIKLDVMPEDRYHSIKEIEEMVGTMVEHASKRRNYKE